MIINYLFQYIHIFPAIVNYVSFFAKSLSNNEIINLNTTIKVDEII